MKQKWIHVIAHSKNEVSETKTTKAKSIRFPKLRMWNCMECNERGVVESSKVNVCMDKMHMVAS